jgi:glutathione S-transferase
MKIYADPITINCRKVMAGLALMNVPYELVYVDYFKGQQKEDRYTSVNPNASIPALVDGDLVLWESNAILAYAADKHGSEAFYPRSNSKRADVNRWLFWESSAWFPSCYLYLVENCIKPLLGAETDQAAVTAQNEQFHKLAGILDARLAKSKWLCGDTPTIADIVIAAPMHLHGWQKLPLAEHAPLRRWMTEGVEQLPSWQNSYVGEGFALKKAA